MSAKSGYAPKKEFLKTFGPAILIAVLGFAIAYQYVDAAPPNQIRMASGQADGAYRLFAQRYRELLSEHDIDVEILETDGSLENIGLLETATADLAFVQSGTGEEDVQADLISLGSLYLEPLWLFHREDLSLEQLSDLRKARIAVGRPGSGTRAVALQLLLANGVTEENSDFLTVGARQAADGLARGTIDAAFLVASPQAPAVQTLMRQGSVTLMSFTRSDAYTRKFPFLSSVTLARGVIDLGADIPARDVRLLATGANLVVRSDFHPALIDLLLQAATRVHGSGSVFDRPGQFPSSQFLAFPLSKEAQRFYKSGPPFLQRYLPFWAATLVDRLKIMLLPLIALVIPLFKIMPPTYRWRMRSRIYRWYREIRGVETMPERTGDARLDWQLAELDRIEQDVIKVSVPLSFADELYDLRMHLKLVRDKLQQAGSNRRDTGAPE